MLVVFLGIIGIPDLYWHKLGYDYQKEVSRIVSPDFVLVSSHFESRGIDVGPVLTDDYTTHLSYGQSITILQSNGNKKGYTSDSAPCFGGFGLSGYPGRIEVCETKYVNGETTFEISLYHFE